MDYNQSVRARRPARNNNNSYHGNNNNNNNNNYNEYGNEGYDNQRYGYHQEEEDDVEEDEEEEEDDNNEYERGYYHVSGGMDAGESSRRHHQKKRRLDNLVGNYEYAPRGSNVGKDVYSGGVGGGVGGGGDEWSENATFVLLEVWGDRYTELGRRSLRGEDWVEVAEKVSEMCKMEINETQCRNRLETLKKKYKKEKGKMEDMGMGGRGIEGYHGKWGFFKKMDMLFSPKRQHNGLPCGVDSGEYVFMNTKVYLNQSNAMDEMRDSPGESESDEDGEDDLKDDEGFRLLAESVQNFGEIYEKIEGRKRQQMMELEQMRQDFQRELELQKKQILERAQAEIAKIREGDDEDINSAENISG